jgi:hypothetical protein
MSSTQRFAKTLRENRLHIPNMLFISRVCLSKRSKSQRGPRHPYGPRPTNRRHLSAVQEMFGRGRRWRFCGVKGSFGSSMSRFGQLEGPLRFRSLRSMAASLSTTGNSYCSAIMPQGGVQAGATPAPLKQRIGRTCGGSSLGEDVPPVGLVDQNQQKSTPCRLPTAFRFRGVCKVNWGWKSSKC